MTFDDRKVSIKIHTDFEVQILQKKVALKMLRAVVTKLCASNRICTPNALNIGQSEMNIQSIRWRRIRRPLELGTSKSKLFRIPVHKEQPTEEKKELTRLNAIYR